jgi:hypothetical protein
MFFMEQIYNKLLKQFFFSVFSAVETIFKNMTANNDTISKNMTANNHTFFKKMTANAKLTKNVSIFIRLNWL